MLMHTREGTTIVTQQEKLKTKPDNRWTIHFKGSALFDPFCCRESFISYLQGQFSFSQRTTPVELSPLLLDTFFKSSTLPWKNQQQTASWSFSWSCSPATIDFQKKSFFLFLYGAGPVANLSLAWPLRDLKSSLRSLRNLWNSISR